MSNDTPNPSPQEDQGLPMPPAEGSSTGSSPTIHIPAPATPGKQILQLVLIPAIIVCVCVGLFLFISWTLNSGADDLEKEKRLVEKIKNIGYEDFAFAKDAEIWRNAAELGDRVTILYAKQKQMPANPSKEELAQAQKRQLRMQFISSAFAKALDPQRIPLIQNIKPKDKTKKIDPKTRIIQEKTIAYFVLGISKLGQPSDFKHILFRKDSQAATVKLSVLHGLIFWEPHYTPQTRDQAIDTALHLLKDPLPIIADVAALTLGVIGEEDNLQVIQALGQCLNGKASKTIDTKFNAAIALARFNNPAGSQYVANIMLNRGALEKLLSENLGPKESSQNIQIKADNILYRTLKNANSMKSAIIWKQIAKLADDNQGDTNATVKAAAIQSLKNHGDNNKTP